MTKRKVPVEDARGTLSVATVCDLLGDSLLDLDEGQELTLKRPLLFVALRYDGEPVQIVFNENSLLARVRTEKKADYQTFYLRSADGRQVATFKKSGYHSFQSGDKFYFIKYNATNTALHAMPRSTLETSLGVAADANRSYGTWSASA